MSNLRIRFLFDIHIYLKEQKLKNRFKNVRKKYFLN